ncbi:MAG TPA: GGDEF domain-containing protein, partial [Erythrobacter sp.]|nr:GGDEF domain-containing protein [Erythrobacter sp.]
LDGRIADLLRPSSNPQPFKLALLDLDGFKPVNDQYGHAFGDKLLCSVADRLRECIGDAGLVVRQGGDEFAVLLPPASALTSAPIADRILISLVRPHVIDGVPVKVSASIGVAQWPDHGECADSLFQCADRALYQAKAEAHVELAQPIPQARERSAQAW